MMSAETRKDPGFMVNPILFLIVAGLTALFVVALYYQILINR
jgi:hypothetical protein